MVKRTELLAWCLLAALAIAGRVAVSAGPALSNDGYQYLSVADNFRAGHPGQTSLIHFDSERSWGTIPAPMTTFPAGYPFAVSIMSRLGLRAETAGALVSALSILSLILLYGFAGRALGLGALAVRFMIVWTILNAQVAGVAGSVATEGLFTALTFAAIVCFVLAIADPRANKQLGRFLVAGALIGLSYWVRYAGLFFFVAYAALTGWLLVRRRDGSWRRAAGGLALAVGLIGIGLLRNQRLVGTWKGGNAMPVHHRPVEIISKFMASVHHVFLGERAYGFVVVELLFLVGVAALVVLLVRALLRERPASWSTRADVVFCLVVFAALYSAAMIYAGITSPISFGPRMFYPLLPVALLCGGCLLASVEESHNRRTLAILAATTAAYFVINLHHGLEKPSPAFHQIVEKELAGELRTWMDQNIGAGEAIIANRGQATGYVLKRGAVSLVSREYSNQVWDEAAVRALFAKYGIRFLVVYLDDLPDVVVTRESPFLTSLVRGDYPPWLTVAARNHDAVVFRTTP